MSRHGQVACQQTRIRNNLLPGLLHFDAGKIECGRIESLDDSVGLENRERAANLLRSLKHGLFAVAPDDDQWAYVGGAQIRAHFLIKMLKMQRHRTQA